MSYVGRLAPSPTGALHLGNVRTFMIAWLRARSKGGRVILRIEDLDHPKDKPGAASQAIEDLHWLGFDWDEEFVQSTRKHLYGEALERLRSLGVAYPCVCSRRDVEAAQSAPHAGEQLFYPGTCRDRFLTWKEAFDYKNAAIFDQRNVQLPCWRFRVPNETAISFDDVFAGRYEQNVGKILGDFPIARDEFGAGYTLAVVVDDAMMGVTEVVRGDDLLQATPAQILLQKALGLSTPSYCHVPLVVGKDGKRLAKRHGDTRVATFRKEGVRPELVLGMLASSCGWCGRDDLVTLRDLIPHFNLATIPHTPFMI